MAATLKTKQRRIRKDPYGRTESDDRLDRYAVVIGYAAAALYCIAFAFFVLIVAALNINSLAQYSLVIFVLIGILFGTFDSGPLFPFVLCIGFVSLGAMWFWPYRYAAFGGNLGAVSYYAIVSLAVAMLTRLLTHDWSALRSAKRAVDWHGTRRMVVNLFLMAVAIVLLMGPFWPNIQYRPITEYILAIHIASMTRSSNFTLSMSPLPYYVLEPFCITGWGTNVSVGFTATSPASVFVLAQNLSQNYNYYYNKTYQDYLSIFSGVSAYSVENSTRGSLGGPINSRCFDIAVLSDTYNQLHAHVAESFTAAQHVNIPVRVMVPSGNFTFGPIFNTLGYTSEAIRSTSDKSS